MLLPEGRVDRPHVGTPEGYSERMAANARESWRRGSRWTATGDSLHVRLSTGLSGWDLRLARASSSADDTYEGEARYLTDVVVPDGSWEPPVVAVRVRRETCTDMHEASVDGEELADPGAARAAAAALLEHGVASFPSVWGGIPAEIYCVQAPDLAEVGALSGLAERLRPAGECRLEYRPGAPTGEQRVRHLPSGRPAVIYTLGRGRQLKDGAVQIDFTWSGAYHFGAGYRCVIEPRTTGWRVRSCVRTSDHRDINQVRRRLW